MSRPKIASRPEPEPIPDELFQAAVDLDFEARLWLEAVLPLLWDQTPPASSAAVEFGRDLVRLAAAARVCRILRSDLGPDLRLTESGEAERALAAEDQS